MFRWVGGWWFMIKNREINKRMWVKVVGRRLRRNILFGYKFEVILEI